ncbi:MAG TPA: membrane protein insertase YidC [Candidatus Acidoferrales bacterium]|jgi:YidC/Oxa1 family membrane protein insertase|nr:membrane protein insertase YidC [Candidatus Acidoferrales bacterium]
MAEPVNGGSNNQAQPPKQEMSMEMRLLLAFILMGAVMFVWQFLYKPEAPPPVKKAAVPTQTTPATDQPPPTEPAAAPAPTEAAQTAAPSAAPTSRPTAQRSEPVLVVETNFFKVTFSNQGATVHSWILKDQPGKRFRGNDDKPLDLSNASAGAFPFSLYFEGQKPTDDDKWAVLAKKLNWAWYAQTPDPDGLGVTYKFSDGHNTVTKVFHFQRNSYLLTMSCEVAIDGKPIPSMVQWRGGFGDLTLAGAASNQRTLYFDVTQNKLVEQVAAKAAKNGPVTAAGTFSFAGIADTYFAAVFLPENNTRMEQVTFGDTVRTPLEEKPLPYAGVAVSDGAANRFELFVGPKDVDLLRSINPKLEQVVDFGWLGVLAKPLFLVVNWLNDHAVHNFGWAIVLVTVAINFVLFPLKLTNMKSMRKMQALKPQIDAINDRYKNVGLRDPKKAEQNQEVMDLYKKYGVNPMGGCVPMLLQIPFFIAFYKVFTVSVEMRGATWLWVHDLSQPEQIPIKILPLTMIASQFIMQKMTPQAGGDPNQQKMMMFMPLIFGIMFYNFASGLVLYYLTSNLVSMGQQYFFNHTAVAEAAARSVAPPKKTGRK